MPLATSAACERNRDPILGVLRQHFADRKRIIEIGSGTGQHAEYFSAAMPELHWQATERPGYLADLAARLSAAELGNAPTPLAFDVNDENWPPGGYDALFTANTLHIMAWPEVEKLFAGMNSLIVENAKVAVYGPFNYGGRFTSASNAAFDASLKASAPHMGIRDFEAVNELAKNIGLGLVADVAMPANNRCLVWYRTTGKPERLVGGDIRKDA